MSPRRSTAAGRLERHVKQWESHHYGFSRMADIVPEGQSGHCLIKHFEITPHDSALTSIRATQHPGEFVPPGRYAMLVVGTEIMMSDTLNEQRTNTGAVHAAQGDVLIAGLGIGMILVPILADREVRSVTVIEKSPDVIKLVGPALEKLQGSGKLTVVEADIFTWEPLRGKLYDLIYLDIWPTISEDNLSEITTLKRRFARRLRRTNPAARLLAWEEERLRYEARVHRRMDALYR